MKASTVFSVASALLASSDALSVADVSDWTMGLLGLSNMVTRMSKLLVYRQEDNPPKQDIVTWDSHALLINGERAMIFSGEVHPFRLPVPSLYIDLFHKIKALGFNMVSFYVDWALLEGKPGDFRADGIFDLRPFFDAATEAGLYLLARPGPYINAEVSGGGFPGWLQRVRGVLRTRAPDYLAATDNYAAKVGAIIADAQITKGGPVILYQPENEYTLADFKPFPDNTYFQYVIDQARNAGIIVPLINNDVWPAGTSRPGTGEGSVDIYGHDSYPVGFDCANPTVWPQNGLPTTWHRDHMRFSPNTPYSIIEFQGGSFDPFGGWGFEQCSRLVNHEFERVFYKNNVAAGVRIFNAYMTFGGTNWGNLGHPGGYTSYDYAAAIRENRGVDREKYSELKLEAQFLKVSPGYLDTTSGDQTRGVYSDNQAVTITPMLSNETGHFFVVRHSDYRNTGSVSYSVRLPTSAGNLSIPQLGGVLSLHGRDSKFLVTDYPVGNATLLYSTAEIFTWKKFADRTVVVVYGGPGELHEIAIQGEYDVEILEGDGVVTERIDNATVLQYETSSTRRVVQAGDLVFYLLDRNSAYNYWVPDLPGEGDKPAYGTSIMNPTSVIVNGGYLVRSVATDGSSLRLQADFNKTSTALEIIGVPAGVSSLVLNGEELAHSVSDLGNWVAEVSLGEPDIEIPELSSLDWQYLDSLPEIHDDYDDSAWVVADNPSTNNSVAPLRTSVSLYASDYGFHTGALLFRGHFTADGSETELHLWAQGGEASAASVWLDGEFLGSFKGFDYAKGNNFTFALSQDSLPRGSKHIITVAIDTNGLHSNWTPGRDEMKEPRGIIDYTLVSSAPGNRTPISPWKVTGNLGGEDYVDKFRGPLNEGGLYFERRGYHLPSPPLEAFRPGTSPFDDGLDRPGVAFYAANLALDLPADRYDVPLSFVFENVTGTDAAGGDYRAMIYVNGFQYGKYLASIGPQDEFPVPEGILNYNGDNWLGIALWALEPEGARLSGLSLKAGTPVLTGRDEVELVEGPNFNERPGAY